MAGIRFRLSADSLIPMRRIYAKHANTVIALEAEIENVGRKMLQWAYQTEVWAAVEAAAYEHRCAVHCQMALAFVIERVERRSADWYLSRSAAAVLRFLMWALGP